MNSQLLYAFKVESQKCYINISEDKTEYMVMNREAIKCKFAVNKRVIMWVTSLNYLGLS